MITQEFLARIDMARLARAAKGLESGALAVLIEGRNEGAVWGSVRNGEGKVYSVQVAHGYASCSCPDYAYRHVICKHALALALTAAQEGERKPNLKLAKVRSEEERERVRREIEELYGVAA